MIDPVRSAIQHATHTNPQWRGAELVRAGLNQRRDRELDRFRKTAESIDRLAPMPIELELRRSLKASLLRTAGVDEAIFARVRTSRRERLRDLGLVTELEHAPYRFPVSYDVSGPPGSLEMWWAQTSWWWNAPGVNVTWQDDGPHFSGGVHVDSDDLQKYSLRILAQFDLSADRIPDNARGRVRSAPFAHVFGWIDGIAKDIAMFNFDDQWVKCWLNVSQIAWATIPGVNIPLLGDRVPWGYQTASRRLLFMESMGVEGGYLPGRINLPVLEFDLLPAIQHIEIDLQFSFDMQLEGGDSNLGFGGVPDWPSNVVQTFQWELQPA